ncbi:hypothetical protein CVT26_015146 [Gymnopilus dilepis]|uniref:Uncharacterized protein n=1 Tax=Gymnopilus dilepis TaxID=231916 RepID=A0A409WXR1_9AGAR|nr:hypothetical protein CVT26_015146 [Gymnopilus dilepis]
MLSFQGFTATILAANESGDFQELPQYAIQVHEENNEVVCWIPAVDRQNFTVQWKRDRTLVYESCGVIYIDGEEIGNDVIPKWKDKHTSVAWLGVKFEEYWIPSDQPSGDGATMIDHGNFTKRRPILAPGKGEWKDLRFSAALTHEVISRIIVKFDWLLRKLVSQQIHTNLKQRESQSNRYQVRNSEEGSNWRVPQSVEVVATFVFKYRPIDFLISNGMVLQDESKELASPSVASNKGKVFWIRSRHTKTNMAYVDYKEIRRQETLATRLMVQAAREEKERRAPSEAK